MSALKTAIINKVKSNSALVEALTVNGVLNFFNGTVESDFPYACFYVITDTTDHDSLSTFSTIKLQISFFDENTEGDRIDNLDQLTRNLFDKGTLTIDGYYCLSIRHEFSKEMEIEESNLRQIVSQYNIELQKQ